MWHRSRMPDDCYHAAMIRSRAVAPTVLMALVASASAQTVWNVAPGPGPLISNVLAVAAAGDVLVLGPGWYEPFALNRGVTIRGNGANIGYQSFSFFAPQVTIAVPANEVAHLEGVDFSVSNNPYTNVGCGVVVQSGSVRIENCSLARGGAAALSISNATAVVANSTISALGGMLHRPALEATNANVTLRDCTVAGADAALHVVIGIALAPSDAIVVTSSSLHVERSSILGGDQVLPSLAAPGARGLVANQSSVWLADGNAAGGSSSNGVGGTAVVNLGTQPIATANLNLLGGLPGGAASTGPIVPAARLVRLGLSQPWTRGQVSLLTCGGVAGNVYGLRLAFDPTPTALPEVVEPVFANAGIWITAGLLGASGQGTFAVAVPNVASLQHAAVWCQAFSGSALPLHASTIAGGVVR